MLPVAVKEYRGEARDSERALSEAEISGEEEEPHPETE